MIVVTVFILILNQTEYHWVHNQEENCHCNHILFNLQEITNQFPLACRSATQESIFEVARDFCLNILHNYSKYLCANLETN